jgi:Ca2+-binding EF-hand superfamily protein
MSSFERNTLKYFIKDLNLSKEQQEKILELFPKKFSVLRNQEIEKLYFLVIYSLGLFKTIDKNKDFSISKEELGGQLWNQSKEIINKFFQKIDLNKDGKISFDEFVCMCTDEEKQKEYIKLLGYNIFDIV